MKYFFPFPIISHLSLSYKLLIDRNIRICLYQFSAKLFWKWLVLSQRALWDVIAKKTLTTLHSWDYAKVTFVTGNSNQTLFSRKNKSFSWLWIESWGTRSRKPVATPNRSKRFTLFCKLKNININILEKTLFYFYTNPSLRLFFFCLYH